MKRKEKPLCYICQLPAATVEYDHFPVPESQGGTNVLPCCLSCHDAKDRAKLEDWDPSVAFRALSGLWEKAERNERLVLAKLISLMYHQRDAMRSRQPIPVVVQVDAPAAGGV
jgi:hypothetical protein